MTETPLKMSKKSLKNQEKKVSTPKEQPSSKKHQRKGENPVRIPTAADQSTDFGQPNSLICKNSACRAILSVDDTFCRRCSCCICHLFDDNKDPSLWLVCSTESGSRDSCGLSCHIECALQHEKVGVVDHGQLMQLDGSYCCASCGKVTGIVGCWKKQLTTARDARRVDVLCYRISLSYRLLNGTSRFHELHDIIGDAKAKLETEVGPVDGMSVKMARGIVSRLSVADEVHKLCSLAIERADQWLAAVSSLNPNCLEGSLPAACKFLFEEVTSSSVVIVLLDLPAASNNDIKGYKLWYCKSRDETHPKQPISCFSRAQRRILISNLQPCTEYSFRIVSYTDAGNLGHSEAKCFTKSVEILNNRNSIPGGSVNHNKNESPHDAGSSEVKREPKNSGHVEASSAFKVRDLGKILHLAWVQEHGCFEGIGGAHMQRCCGVKNTIKPAETREKQTPSPGLDLNVASVPDLNEELTPPFDTYRDEEDNGNASRQAVEVDDAASCPEIEKNSVARSHGSGDSQNWANGPSIEVPAVDSQGILSLKRALSMNDDCNSTLVTGSPLRITNGLGSLDENFEYCVKIIRWLECEGHITLEFRLKMLTWFCLRATKQERRVVNTFIQTLIDDPSSLAAQLVDSFSDIISSKRPRNGFCSKLWH